MIYQTAELVKYAVKLTSTTQHSLGLKENVVVWGIGLALGGFIMNGYYNLVFIIIIPVILC